METVQQASFETPSNSRIDRNSFRAVPSNSQAHVVNNEDDYISEEEAKKRRELLERRPSYRKILSDLSESERDLVKKEVGEALQLPARAVVSCANAGKAGTSGVNSVIGSPPLLGHLIPGRPDVTMNYAGTSVSDGELNFGGLNTPSLSTAALIHYASQQGQDNSGNLLIPFGLKVSHHNMMSSAHSSDSPGSSPLVSPSLEMINSPSGNHSGMPDEANRKRELRLMKNREAAKECRRKKKEYVRCLEGRVAVLENQNKQLIEELKSLKELYCRKAE